MRKLSLELPLAATLALVIGTAQDLTSYFRLVQEGKLDEVRADLPELRDRYPNRPGIMYLDALTRERAEDAIIAYRKLIQNHPNSEYADDAVMKIGEYLFARGLYTQASRQLGRLPKVYPHSEHVQRAIDLQVNSFLATGERDSAEFYVQVYQRRFPRLDLNYNLEPGMPVISRPLTAANVVSIPLPGEQQSVTPGKSTPVKKDVEGEPVEQGGEMQGEAELAGQLEPQPARTVRPFVIQVGAYGSINNALRQKQILEQMGYTVDLWPISPKGKKLNAVQVVRFTTRAEAEKVGKKLKANLGYNFIILNRPE